MVQIRQRESADTGAREGVGLSAAGSAEAQLRLGRKHLEAGDTYQAREWLERAARGGDPEAQRVLEQLAPATVVNTDLNADQRRQVAALLADLDAAANARDAALLTEAIARDAPIRVRLPGDSGFRQLDRFEYRALWQATFDRADRYRFNRHGFDIAASADGLTVTSQVVEYLTRDDHTQRLRLEEDLVLDLNENLPRITAVQLVVTPAPQP